MNYLEMDDSAYWIIS